MLAVVRIALSRPYTFVVMAMLIVIFGVAAAIRTPTDIFPNIGIPVVAVVWTYNGLPPDDMSGRVIYYYERTLSAQVNDIEHIESQSLAGYGVVKVFFQPNVNINAALAQIKTYRKNLNKTFFDIGVVLKDIQTRRLYEAKRFPSFEAFVEREIDLGKTTALRLVRVASLFQKESALELGMDRLFVAIAAIDTAGEPSEAPRIPPPPTSRRMSRRLPGRTAR